MLRLIRGLALLLPTVALAYSLAFVPRPGWGRSATSGVQEATQKQPPLAPLPAAAPAPADNPTTPAKVELGKMLFFDPRLSGDNQMSCATCHLPEKAFGDGRAVSPGAGGKPLARNTPTCLNAGFYSSLFWDGRAGSLEEQALGPIQSTVEMNQNLQELVAELATVPGYVRAFDRAFGGPPSPNTIAKALAAFQRTLITRDSAFDRYLAGDEGALTPDAKAGLELFQGEAGCVRCHNGALLSDGKFYRLGTSFRDTGREQITHRPEDRYRFRTPSLRDVAETGPYMHDGGMKTLDEVVTFYYRNVPAATPEGQQLDLEPLAGQSFSDIPLLVAFLRSLSGQPPAVKPPILP